jgi:hypothetical protein
MQEDSSEAEKAKVRQEPVQEDAATVGRRIAAQWTSDPEATGAHEVSASSAELGDAEAAASECSAAACSENAGAGAAASVAATARDTVGSSRGNPEQATAAGIPAEGIFGRVKSTIGSLIGGHKEGAEILGGNPEDEAKLKALERELADANKKADSKSSELRELETKLASLRRQQAQVQFPSLERKARNGFNSVMERCEDADNADAKCMKRLPCCP